MIKTNLFKGDRVRLTASGITMFTSQKVKERIGTIVNDPLLPRTVEIAVHWDGNAKANRGDVYSPDELELVEEEESVG